MPSGEISEFRLVCCIVNQSAVELHGRRLYTNSCFTAVVVHGPMNNRVNKLLFANNKKGSSLMVKTVAVFTFISLTS